jgi:hypothetical protein
MAAPRFSPKKFLDNNHCSLCDEEYRIECQKCDATGCNDCDDTGYIDCPDCKIYR